MNCESLFFKAVIRQIPIFYSRSTLHLCMPLDQTSPFIVCDGRAHCCQEYPLRLRRIYTSQCQYPVSEPVDRCNYFPLGSTDSWFEFILYFSTIYNLQMPRKKYKVYTLTGLKLSIIFHLIVTKLGVFV